MISQEQILAKIEADLNALVVSMGFVDSNNIPLYYFHGELSSYDNYNWIKAVEYKINNAPKYLNIIPFALIRDTSTPSNGELIEERFDEFSLYAYIKSPSREDIREILETYMYNENNTDNPGVVASDNVLKEFTNFVIDDEELTGAPDGETRQQVNLKFTYDIFEGSLASSQDYELLLDGEKIKYLSWRFEKANMVVANSSNTLTGTDIGNANKLHEITFVCELYINKSSTAITKLRNDIFSQVKTNVKYALELKFNGTTLFTRDVVLNGAKATDTRPQINCYDVTFGLSYDRLGLQIGVVGNNDTNGEQIYEDVPVFGYKIVHASALQTATYMGDNKSRSRIIGQAKSFGFTMPVLISGSEVISTLYKEILGEVYTNRYALKLTFLGLTFLYTVVLNNGDISGDDAAYDIITPTFVEAK